MAWGKNGTPNTLTSTSSTLDITDLTANQFGIQLVHAFHTASLFHYGRLDGNSGSNYSLRSSALGAADTTAVNQDKYYIGDSTSANDEFSVAYIANISGKEKLIIGHAMGRNTAGAGNAPRRREHVAKFTVTAGQVTEYNSVVSTSTFATDSNISALGSDLTPAAAVPGLGANVQVGSRYEETDTRKMYNWSGSAWEEIGA